MVEQKKIVKEDIYEKRKLYDQPVYQKPSVVLPPVPKSNLQQTDVKQFNEPGRISDITQQENILIKNKPIIEEIHERTNVEIHEKPIIKNVKEPLEKRYIKDQTITEEYGDKLSGEKLIQQNLGTAPLTKKIKMVPNVTQINEAPIITREDRILKEVHYQPVIHEIHEKPVQEIHEQNVIRVVHDKPTVTKVKEEPVYVSENAGLQDTLKNQERKFTGGSGDRYGTTGLSSSGGKQFGVQAGIGTGGNQYGTSGLSGGMSAGGQTGLSSGAQTGMTGGQPGLSSGGNQYGTSGLSGGMSAGGQTGLASGQPGLSSSGGIGTGGGNQFGVQGGIGTGGKEYGTTGLTSGKTEGLSSGVGPKVLKKEVDTKFGGQKDWKKTKVVRDESGNVYEEKNIHKEHETKLPTLKKGQTGTVTDTTGGVYERQSPYNRTSPYSSPSSPSERRGGSVHNLKEKIKNVLHVGSSDTTHHKKTY